MAGSSCWVVVFSQHPLTLIHSITCVVCVYIVKLSKSTPTSYEPKDPAIKVGMRQMLVQPGHLKGGYLLVTPLTSPDK